MLLQEIRDNERQSHIEAYTNNVLYSNDSWLKRPVKTVLDILPYFQNHSHLHVLDLGCGIGRNCIAVAKYFSSVPCHIDCVDLLELAIVKLMENAEKYQVSDSIHGVVCSIDDYQIPSASYDLILAISALEHVDNEGSFVSKLAEIKNGIQKNGIACLIINSSVTEYDKSSGCEIPAQFEVNLSAEELSDMLKSEFSEWQTIKFSQQKQHYEIPRKNGPVDLYSTVITFVAKR